jgi:hypothetical protein
LTSSRVAEFVLFISGTCIAFVHFFLRANAARTAIKPSAAPWHERRRFRMCGPSDLELMNISSPIIENRYKPDEKVADIWARQQAEKDMARGGKLTTPAFTFPSKAQQASRTTSWPIDEPPMTPPKGPRSPTTPKAANSSKILPSHKRNQQSYSLFPGSDDLRLPATVYTPNANPFSSTRKSSINKQQNNESTATSKKLTSPSVTDIREAALQPPVTPWTGHRRGSSADSSATVQIGIRFSAAPAALAASAFRGNSTLTPHRPSLRAVIDTVSPPQSQSKLATTSQSTQSRLDSPFDPQWNFAQSTPKPSDTRNSDASDVSEFAWLDTTDAEQASSPNYISRQNSQSRPPPTAASNRYEIDALQRNGSSRSRQGYKPPTTPDGPSTGFF